jgi:nucleotide-binding universal stress UspA family protein
MASKPIVAGTDGSEESLQAVGWAAREAALRGAPLRIVATAGLLPRMRPHTDETQYETVTDVLVDDRDRALAMAAERAAKAAAGVLIDTDELTGPTAQSVTQSGAGALMLVLGSRGTGAFTALLLGSVSRYAASHASSPVVVIRDDPSVPRGLIGVGVADTDSCRDALSFALEEASLRHASLHAVHAWHTPQTEISRAGQFFTESSAQAAADAARQLAGLLDECRAKYPDVPVTQEVVHGHPARALAGLSARADLVVIGRRPGTPGPGSVRHALLNHAHGPVAVVPSPAGPSSAGPS